MIAPTFFTRRFWSFSAVAAFHGLMALGCAPRTSSVADQFVAEGRWDEAVASYRLAARQTPFNADLETRLGEVQARAAEEHYQAGRTLVAGEHYPEAIEEFKVALGLAPSQAEYQAALRDAGRRQSALEHFRVGKKFEELGRLADAALAYEQAIELDLELAKAANQLTEVTRGQKTQRKLGGLTGQDRHEA